MEIIDHMDCDANYNKNLLFKKTIANSTCMLVKLFRENFKSSKLNIFLLINWSKKVWVALDEPCVNGI